MQNMYNFLTNHFSRMPTNSGSFATLWSEFANQNTQRYHPIYLNNAKNLLAAVGDPLKCLELIEKVSKTPTNLYHCDYFTYVNDTIVPFNLNEAINLISLEDRKAFFDWIIATPTAIDSVLSAKIVFNDMQDLLGSITCLDENDGIENSPWYGIVSLGSRPNCKAYSNDFEFYNDYSEWLKLIEIELNYCGLSIRPLNPYGDKKCYVFLPSISEMKALVKSTGFKIDIPF